MQEPRRSDWRDDPTEVERAKQAAAGELGRELVRFPLRFAQPIIIGNAPAPEVEPEINNGTATLVRLAGGEFAITCAHVIAAYRKRVADGSPTHLAFQIGTLEIDPLERLVDEYAALDIAVLEITGLRYQRASVRGGPFEFHEPVRWPPGPTAVGDVVSLAGFPGEWRQPPVNEHIEFDTLAIGGQAVTTSSRNRIVCQFEREYWVQSYGLRGHEARALGGMSGGPIMVMRALHWELAGIITDFSPAFDLLYGAPVVRINEGGRIARE